MPTHQCPTDMLGTVSGGPSVQSATKKYILFALSGANGGPGFTFKVVAPNAFFDAGYLGTNEPAIATGMRLAVNGKWRENQPPAGALLHVIDATGIFKGDTVPGAPDQ